MAIRKSITAFEPSTSLILADSKYRTNQEESPTDFTAILSASLRAQRFIYNGITWTQPFFTHTSQNCEIILEIQESNGVEGQGPFVGYANPWRIFNSFDGNPPGSFAQPPQPGSYAGDIEHMLNNDLRLLSSNLVPVSPTSNAQLITFYFRYNPATGFVIYAFSADNRRMHIRLLPCSWLQYSHNVHGFGKQDPEDHTKIIPVSENFSACIFGTPPTLVYTRYISIFCKEISERRTYPSITNNLDNNKLPFEIGVFFVDSEWSGTLRTQRSTGDETVIPLQFGVEPQKLRITMIDEFGEIPKCGNPLTTFHNDPNVPSHIFFEAITNPYQRTPRYMNFLLFGHTPTDGHDINLFSQYSRYNFDNGPDAVSPPAYIQIAGEYNAPISPWIMLPNTLHPMEFSTFTQFLFQPNGHFKIRRNYNQAMNTIFTLNCNLFYPGVPPWEIILGYVRLKAHLGIWGKDQNPAIDNPVAFALPVPNVEWDLDNTFTVPGGKPVALQFIILTSLINENMSHSAFDEFFLGLYFWRTGGPFIGGDLFLRVETPYLNQQAILKMESNYSSNATYNATFPIDNPLFGNPTDIKLLSDEIIHSISIQLE